MQLINLEPGRLGLEYSQDEWPTIARRLRDFGRMTRESLATCDLIYVAGESFILTHDWGQSALISRSVAADFILTRVFKGQRRLKAREQRMIARNRLLRRVVKTSRFGIAA